MVLLSLIGICSICYFFNLHLRPLFLLVFTSYSLSCSGFEHLRGKELLLNHCGNQPVCDDSKQLSHLPLPFPNQPEEAHLPLPFPNQPGEAHLPLPFPNQPEEAHLPLPFPNQPGEAHLPLPFPNQLGEAHLPLPFPNQPEEGVHGLSLCKHLGSSLQVVSSLLLRGVQLFRSIQGLVQSWKRLQDHGYVNAPKNGPNKYKPSSTCISH